MSVIGNQPGVSSQRTVLEEVITGSPKSAFVPQAGYIAGYVDVLVNGLEIDTNDFTATDGLTINLVTPAAVGDTVKVKAWLPRGLSDGYLKTEADAKFATKTSAAGTTAFDATAATWWGGGKQVQLGGGTALWDYNAVGNSQTRLFNNLYLDASGSARYLTTNNGTIYQQYNGVHTWSKAPNGTAGALATITDLMTLSATGVLALQNANATATGTGIAFPATQIPSSDANTLDDYEEGTWTPSVNGSNTPGSATYSVRLGRYTKIGRVVTASFDLILSSSVTGGVGFSVIAGLPFPIVASAAGYLDGGSGVVGYFASLGGANYTMTLYGDNGNTSCLPVYGTGGASITYLPLTSTVNGSRISGIFTYTTST